MKQEIIKCPNYSFAESELSERIHQCLSKAQHVLIFGPIPNSRLREPDGSYTHHFYYRKLKEYISDVLLKGKSAYNAKSIQVIAQDTSVACNFVQNIVISSAYDFFNNEMVIEDNKAWLKNVGLVIFENTTEFISFNRFWQGLISHFLYNFTNCEIIYLAAERAKLEDSIASEFNTDAKLPEEAYNNNNQPIGFLYFTAWNRENLGDLLQTKWTHVTMQYAGMEPVILYHAFKSDINNYYSINYSKNNPYEDYIEEIEEEWNNFRDYVDINYIQFQKNIDKRFIATDDIYNNLSYTIYRHRLPRNGKMYLNVCSVPYLFRDYMAANIDYFNQYVLYPLSPVLDRSSHRNILLTLFEILRRYPLKRKQVANFLNIGDSDKLHNYLLSMYNEEFGRNLKGILVEELELHSNSAWKKESFLKIRVDSDEWLDKRTELFKILQTNFGNVTLDTVPKDLIIPYFTSKRYFSYQGKNFKIHKIDYESKQVLLQKHAVDVNENIYYSRLANEINISSHKNTQNTLLKDEIEKYVVQSQGGRIHFALCDLYTQSIQMAPYKRYDFLKEYDYSKADYITKNNLGNLLVPDKKQKGLTRTYKNEKVLFIHLKVIEPSLFNPEDTEMISRLSATLTYLLKQCLESFLPDSFMFLDVLCLNSYEQKDDYSFISKVNFKPEDFDATAITIAVVEDAIQDLGLLRAVKENFDTIWLYLDDYLQWYLSQGEYESTVPNESVDFSLLSKANIPFSSRKEKKQRGINLNITEVEFGYNGEIKDKVPSAIKTDLLKVNGGKYPSFFELDTLKRVLALKLGNYNSITKKRLEYLKRREIPIIHTISDNNLHQCDMCGMEGPVENFKVIKDGRERCPECSTSNPWDKKEEITTDIEEHVNTFFRKIKQKKPVNDLNVFITYTNEFNKEFAPTRFYDPRAIGLAVLNSDETGLKYDMFVENGMPEKQSILTTIHEWTHIWQYNNLDYQAMNRDYNKLLIEGHAVWSEIFFAAKIQKWDTVEYWENYFAPPSRKDEYGDGYRLVKQMLKQIGIEDAFEMLIEMYSK